MSVSVIVYYTNSKGETLCFKHAVAAVARNNSEDIKTEVDVHEDSNNDLGGSGYFFIPICKECEQ